jgi:hypothetical protein
MKSPVANFLTISCVKRSTWLAIVAVCFGTHCRVNGVRRKTSVTVLGYTSRTAHSYACGRVLLSETRCHFLISLFSIAALMELCFAVKCSLSGTCWSDVSLTVNKFP